ncbi:hypothetical protein NEF87_001947 [Candidatus Lokiarchaeum ossiferum]|uniref:Phosphohistidine phosphatase SixA n=1 Tax=Candidatus Lokiarchaeum ossiferum TaxID=2951803 RepID=A0ABY6HQ90_9ARCH|nr:hypothetical protein NEF87_001947 [Candidatus Lokiarchaeum sp. B-35]
MKLFLVQHALAYSKQDDPERSLTPIGIESLEKIVHFTKKQLNPQISCIFHSGKKRAQQTAEIIAKILHPATEVRSTTGLNPSDDPQIWFQKLIGVDDNIMIVGHLPHLNRFAQLLLGQEGEKTSIDFQNAGIVCLEKYSETKWVVVLEILPNMIEK